MKLKQIIILLTTAFFFNCSTLVLRSPDNIPEKGNRQLPLEFKSNIFKDFLWLAPPVYGKELRFIDNKATANMDGRIVEFEKLSDSKMSMKFNSESMVLYSQASEANLYYNMDILEWKNVPKQRYVSKHVWVDEPQQVMKTRWVTQTVPVQKTRTVSDPITGTRIEYYTDFETRQVSETYWDTEIRQVMKTEWEWVTVMVPVLDIPRYIIYNFSIQDDLHLILYQLEENGEKKYYLQNIGYLSAVESEIDFWGNSQELKIIIIDANSNGYFFDDDDKILFNTWNPYNEDSSYQEIDQFMDNMWYRLVDLKEDMFLRIGANESSRKLMIQNANSDFIDSKEKGEILISQLDKNSKIFINGMQYFADKDGVFKSPIEYGYFRLRISKPGYLDYQKTFLIDEDHPSFSYSYRNTEKAGTLILKNHGYRNWKVTAIDMTTEKSSSFYNTNEIALKSGEYKIILTTSGVNFAKELTIANNETWIYDFTADSLFPE